MMLINASVCVYRNQLLFRLLDRCMALSNFVFVVILYLVSKYIQKLSKLKQINIIYINDNIRRLSQLLKVLSVKEILHVVFIAVNSVQMSVGKTCALCCMHATLFCVLSSTSNSSFNIICLYKLITALQGFPFSALTLLVG